MGKDKLLDVCTTSRIQHIIEEYNTFVKLARQRQAKQRDEHIIRTGNRTASKAPKVLGLTI